MTTSWTLACKMLTSTFTGYPKPSTGDIFSCNTGPFGNITQYNNQHQVQIEANIK